MWPKTKGNMALNIIEAANGYPVTLIGRNFDAPRSSEGVSLLNQGQNEYSEYAAGTINSKSGIKRARKYRRRIMTVNVGNKMLSNLVDNLQLGPVDTLYILEQHPRRIENAARMAESLRIAPEDLVLSQGSLLDTPDSQMFELAAQRLDYIIFGLGSPSQDRRKRNMNCRVEEEMIKAHTLLRVGGSLVMAPSLRDVRCVDLTLPETSFQINQDIPPQQIGNFRAMRAIRLR